MIDGSDRQTDSKVGGRIEGDEEASDYDLNLVNAIEHDTETEMAIADDGRVLLRGRPQQYDYASHTAAT